MSRIADVGDLGAWHTPGRQQGNGRPNLEGHLAGVDAHDVDAALPPHDRLVEQEGQRLLHPDIIKSLQGLLAGYVPVAPVYELDAALDNPWLSEIGMRQVIAHPDAPELHVLACPIKVDGARMESRAGPLMGADTDALLADCGYDEAQIADLRAAGVV